MTNQRCVQETLAGLHTEGRQLSQICQTFQKCPQVSQTKEFLKATNYTWVPPWCKEWYRLLGWEKSFPLDYEFTSGARTIVWYLPLHLPMLSQWLPSIGNISILASSAEGGAHSKNRGLVSPHMGTRSPMATSPEAPASGPSSPGCMPPTLVSSSLPSYQQIT